MDIPQYSLEELQSRFPSAANYLLTIFLIQREYGEVQNFLLAEKLSVSKPAVNQAVGRLKSLGLARQHSYGKIQLTETGQSHAIALLRKHYLAEYMLIKRMNYPWDKSDSEAQRLQQSISDEFTEYLYEFFGHPETCPHGNPFPGAPAEKDLLAAPRLNHAPPDVPLELLRITEEGEAVQGLLKFCNMHNLYPGTRLRVVRFLKDDRVEVESEGMKILIPIAFATYLCYRKP